MHQKDLKNWVLAFPYRNREDLQRFFLSSSKMGRIIQDDVDMIVIDGSFNDVRVRHMIDLVHKNMTR